MKTTDNIDDNAMKELKQYAKDRKMSYAAAFRHLIERGLEDLKRNPDKEPPMLQSGTFPRA